MLHFRYTAWAEGEPNDSGDGEDCAVLFDMYMGEQLERFSLSKCIQKRNDFCPQTKMVRRSLWGDRYVRSGLPPNPRPVWGKDLDKNGKRKKIRIKDFSPFTSVCACPSGPETLTESKCLFGHFSSASLVLPTLLSKESLLPILDQLPTGDQHKTWSWENFLD